MGRRRRSLVAFLVHAVEALGRELGRGRIGVIARDLQQRLARGRPVLQFVIAVADLEQGIGTLARIRPVVEGERT